MTPPDSVTRQLTTCHCISVLQYTILTPPMHLQQHPNVSSRNTSLNTHTAPYHASPSPSHTHTHTHTHIISISTNPSIHQFIQTRGTLALPTAPPPLWRASPCIYSPQPNKYSATQIGCTNTTHHHYHHLYTHTSSQPASHTTGHSLTITITTLLRRASADTYSP